jgi:hypothetical protein
MPEKPDSAAGYRGQQVTHVRATCLYVASKLGDLMDDLVVVGGLVPSLLVDQETLVNVSDAHVGTMDLDVGLAVTLLNQGRYRSLTSRLNRRIPAAGSATSSPTSPQSSRLVCI